MFSKYKLGRSPISRVAPCRGLTVVPKNAWENYPLEFINKNLPNSVSFVRALPNQGTDGKILSVSLIHHSKYGIFDKSSIVISL